MENNSLNLSFEENILKLPLSHSLWNILGKSKGRINNCYTCDILPLDKKDCYSWYKSEPAENDYENIDNIVLVCKSCKDDMLKKKKYADFYKKKYCKKKKIVDEYSHLDEIDHWDIKFGTCEAGEKSAICEICNTTILYKNKSSYGFIKNEGENNDSLKLQCRKCFLEELKCSSNNDLTDNDSSEYDEYIPQNINNINDIDECSDKMPGRFYLWKFFMKEKRKMYCLICNEKLNKKYSYVWYNKLPKEGGNQDLNNFNLVCEKCQYKLSTKKKGIESYKKYLLKKNKEKNNL